MYGLKKICSVIDTLSPDMIKTSQQSEPGESESLSAASLLEDAGSQQSHVDSRDFTSDTYLSERTEGGAFKKQGSGIGVNKLSLRGIYCYFQRSCTMMMPSKELKA